MAFSTSQVMFLGIVWIAIIFVFLILGDYNPSKTTGSYSMFQDVHIMIFVGFGFLMSFLVHGSFTSTGHSLMVAVCAAIFSMINSWLWGDVIVGANEKGFRLGVDSLVDADFAAGAVLISFGALIGRVSLLQLIAMAFVEVIFYNINAAVCYGRLAAADIGGSMVIHTFGAYFGLTVSLLFDRSIERKEKRAGKWASDHNSDTLAMVGTLFLWCFWPSFNAYFGGVIEGGGVGERVVVNTYMSLCGSVVATFLASAYFGKGKLNIVDIQNATLAGGVAIGAASNMLTMPGGALLIGTAAGTLSTVGYNVIQPLLEKKFGLVDTCGVHNLHGMPGLFGALVSIFMSARADSSIYSTSGYSWTTVWPNADRNQYSAASLVGLQIASLLLTLGFAVGGGVVASIGLRYLPDLSVFYQDSAEWIVEEEGHGEEAHHNNNEEEMVTTTVVNHTAEEETRVSH